VFRSLGAGAIAVTAAAVLAAFTLLPALIGLLGDRIEALRIPLPRVSATRGRFWDGAQRLAARRPLASFAVAAAVLLAAAAPTLRMNAGFAGIEKSAFLPFHERRAMLRDIAGELQDFEVRNSTPPDPSAQSSQSSHPSTQTVANRELASA
jgi:uncharacterized membrane protein YdfJ with MMPL/SSD domain